MGSYEKPFVLGGVGGGGGGSNSLIASEKLISKSIYCVLFGTD